MTKGICRKTGKVWNKDLTKETDERVLRNSKSNTGKKRSADFVKYCSERSLAFWQNPEYVAKQNASRRIEVRRETLRKAREVKKEMGLDPWNKNKTECYSPETRQSMGIKNIGNTCRRNKSHTLEARKKNSDAQKINWQSPEYVQKQMKARGVKPNKVELKLEIFLKKSISKDWRFVGDGQLIIGGKCPDFWNGDHKLIELFGNYWHEGEDPKVRINYFKNHGYDTLVVWEEELLDVKSISRKIIEFVNLS